MSAVLVKAPVVAAVEGLAVRCVRVDDPGNSRARNVALAEASTEIVAFVDDDTRPNPGWLSALLSGFGRDDDVAVVGGRIRLVWPGGQAPAWMTASLDRLLAENLISDGTYQDVLKNYQSFV